MMVVVMVNGGGGRWKRIHPPVPEHCVLSRLHWLPNSRAVLLL